MQTRLSGHGAYKTEYHIVWITKYRRRILNPGVTGYLLRLLPKIMKSLPGCEIMEQNVQPDHIHLVMVIPPWYRVSDVVGRIKQFTASHLLRKFAFLGKVYWRERVVWSPGYFVSTVGLDEARVLKHVAWQGSQDSGQAKLEF
jgi:putative transposase